MQGLTPGIVPVSHHKRSYPGALGVSVILLLALFRLPGYLIYAGAMGSVIWLDLVYGMGIAFGLPILIIDFFSRVL